MENAKARRQGKIGYILIKKRNSVGSIIVVAVLLSKQQICLHIDPGTLLHFTKKILADFTFHTNIDQRKVGNLFSILWFL